MKGAVNMEPCSRFANLFWCYLDIWYNTILYQLAYAKSYECFILSSIKGHFVAHLNIVTVTKHGLILGYNMDRSCPGFLLFSAAFQHVKIHNISTSMMQNLFIISLAPPIWYCFVAYQSSVMSGSISSIIRVLC